MTIELSQPTKGSDSYVRQPTGQTDTARVHVVAVCTPVTGDCDDSGDVAQHGKKIGVPAAVFSYLCACVGAGVLSLPAALQFCGWFGVILMAFVALLCNQTAKYLLACMFTQPGRILRSYEDIGEAAMGPRGRQMVGFFQTITLFGVCTIFLILIGGNMNTLVPQLSLHAWIFIFAAVLIPIAWLKTQHEVSYLAVFGVLASLYVIGVVVVKGFMRCADPEEGAPPIRYEFIDPEGLPSALNIIVFSFGSHSVLPSIIAQVKEPQLNYAKVSGWSYILIAALYILTGAAGYAGWGLSSSPNILNNMPNSPEVQAAYAFITAHVVLTYPLPLNPLSLALESILGIDQKSGMAELIPRCLSRTCLVLLTVFIASVVPYFGDVLSIVSALSIVAVAFVLPPLFYYKLHPDRYFSLGEKATMIFIALFGLAAAGIGLYYAIKGLVDSVESNPSPFDNYF